jgi:hypothetical protein
MDCLQKTHKPLICGLFTAFYLAFLLQTFPARAQTINLYVNKFTGKYTSYNGEYSKTTDKYTRGVINCTVDGPITYSVTPADLLIFENETKSWKGSIYPDLTKVPIPGTYRDATLKADYSITYARAQGTGSGGTVLETWTCNGTCMDHPNGPGVHEKVNKTGIREVPFRVYSLYLSLPDTVKLCDKPINIEAEGWPEGGTYVWEITAGPNFKYKLGNKNDLNGDFDMYAPYLDHATVKVIYTVGGISIDRTCYVKLPRAAKDELKEIKDLMIQAFNNAKPKLPNVGMGWSGNVMQTFSDNYVKCTDVIEKMQTSYSALVKNKKFCNFTVGALVFDGDDVLLGLNAHIYIGIADRNGKVLAYWDPWKYGDATLRRITGSQSYNEFVPWK